jgi:phosphoserine phosphatase RsbU/P
MVFELSRLVELCDNVAVICLLAYLLTRTRYAPIFVNKKHSLSSILFMALAGGLLYIYGVFTAVEIGPYYISIQVIGPAIAGIIAGPIAGLIGGVIGITLEILAGYTIESGELIITLLAGILGGLFIYINKNHHFKIWQFFCLGFIIGVLQLIAGVRGVQPNILDKGEVLEAAMDLFIPVIIGLCIFGFIINNFRTEEDNNRKTFHLEGELEAARKIQLGSLPASTYERGSVSLAASLTPASYIGGDLYDYLSLKDGLIYFAIGDVSGKGIPAALLMSSTRSLLRSMVQKARDPSIIIKEVNRSFIEDGDNNQFITLIVGFLEPESGVIRYCNAGHPPPFLLNNNGCIILESDGNLPAGVMEEEEFKLHHLTMKAGESLILVSDGVTEAEQGNKFYGQTRVASVLKQEIFKPPEEIVSKLLTDINRFTDYGQPSDDCTILVISYNPEKNTNYLN